MKNGSKLGRKFVLFIAMAAALIVLLVFLSAVGELSETVAAIIVISLVVCYLLYVFGNVMSKISFGKYFSAELRPPLPLPDKSDIRPGGIGRSDHKVPKPR